VSDFVHKYRIRQQGKKRKPHFELMLNTYPDLSNMDLSLEDGDKPLGVILGLTETFLEAFPDGFVSNDKTHSTSHSMLAYWKTLDLYGRDIYKMGEGFSKALLNVNLDIPAKHLPLLNKMICIEFPDNLRFNAGPSAINMEADRFINCVYVVVTDEKAETKDGSEAKRTMRCIMPLYDENNDLTMEVQEYGIPIIDLEKTFLEAVERASRFDEVPHNNKDFIKFVLKCLVYIDSGDPDLRDYKAPKNDKNIKGRSWVRANKNNSLLDMTLVGYNHKKNNLRHVDSSIVSGHYRWQRCGKGFSKVKLVFIEEHNRKYEKNKTN